MTAGGAVRIGSFRGSAFFRLSLFLVRTRTVIRLIESGTFENNPRAFSDQAFYFARAHGTNLDRLRFHGLKLLEMM